jgi:hypothetical protein
MFEKGGRHNGGINKIEDSIGHNSGRNEKAFRDKKEKNASTAG